MARAQCLHKVFAANARAHPDRVAVSASDQHITYGALDARASRLAIRLCAAGVKKNVLVGLCADRTVDLIVGLLAILKAGGAYVAIDPEYPPARIRLLVDDSGVRTVLTVSRVASCLDGAGAPAMLMDDGDAPLGTPPAVPKTRPEDLAYVCYTSGSTGAPKGVPIEHRQVARLFEETRHWFAFDAGDVWTMAHSASFDFSVWEIWGALLRGGKLIVVPNDVMRSPERLKRLLQAHGVTVLNMTPSAFRQIVATETSTPVRTRWDLRTVIFGGEALEVSMLAPWIDKYGDERPALVNMYGITETSVHVTYRKIVKDDLSRPAVSPIGVPIPDLAVHVLDESGREVGIGVAGDLHVSGAGVARGYLGRPDLTAERFVYRAAVGGGRTRLYRSGDRAMRLPNGELVYLGRADDQLKIRGFRVEPREIEACLSGHSGVLAAAVAPQDCGDGDVRLMAWIVPVRDDDRGAEALKSDLVALANAQLPAYMRPSAYHVVRELPITAHGKLDRAALQAPLTGAAPSAAADAANLTATELAILRLAEEVLQRSGVGMHDDLFDLGATSLTIMRLVTRINDRFNVSLDGSELADEPALASLARAVESATETYARM